MGQILNVHDQDCVLDVLCLFATPFILNYFNLISIYIYIYIPSIPNYKSLWVFLYIDFFYVSRHMLYLDK